MEVTQVWVKRGEVRMKGKFPSGVAESNLDAFCHTVLPLWRDVYLVLSLLLVLHIITPHKSFQGSNPSHQTGNPVSGPVLLMKCYGLHTVALCTEIPFGHY